MDWVQIGVIIIIASVISAGGVGGIVVGVIKFSSNFIADRLSAKYENKLEKALEKYKTELSKKEYISQTRFDAEFSIYRDLSKSFFEMVKAITSMIPCGLANYPADEEERKKYEESLYLEASKATVFAQDILNQNIPFIQETLFDKCNEIISLCKKQLAAFERRWNLAYLAENKESFTLEEYERSKEINDKFKKLCLEMRTYLSSLEVLE